MLFSASVYCMTKAAISHLTRCLAVEWGPRGTTVNAVDPTFIRTPGTEPALSDQPAPAGTALVQLAVGDVVAAEVGAPLGVRTPAVRQVGDRACR
jgi:NAD(P)-dependent dehydrogenase (short-subunit alcohol dehydrogenase family)